MILKFSTFSTEFSTDFVESYIFAGFLQTEKNFVRQKLKKLLTTAIA